MRLLYTIWCAICLVGLYLILFPIQFVFLQRDAWKAGAHRVNAIWGHVFFALAGIPVRVTYRYRPDPKQVYVFCANHFSYIDIAVMGVVIKNNYAFVGKSDVKTIPLLGYMFAKLHIQVDRNVANSRAYSLSKSIRTLQGGRSIMIFPEGGIVASHIPRMGPFKDGAFTMAIQQQVPIVPITLLTNHRILPDDGRFRMRRYPMRAIVHPPIETTGMTQQDVYALKEAAYRIIDTELKSHEKVVA